MDEKKIWSMIGLAKRAGRVETGSLPVEKCVKSYRACLVIMAGDASDRTKKDLRNMCAYRETDLVEFGTKEALGHALGAGAERSAAAVTDEHFAIRIKQLIEEYSL